MLWKSWKLHLEVVQYGSRFSGCGFDDSERGIRWVFPKIVGYPPKSSILGYPYFWKHPNENNMSKSNLKESKEF